MPDIQHETYCDINGITPTVFILQTVDEDSFQIKCDNTIYFLLVWP